MQKQNKLQQELAAIAAANKKLEQKLMKTRIHLGVREIFGFLATAAIIFVFIFGGMNFSAYKKKFNFWMSNFQPEQANASVIAAEEKSEAKLEKLAYKKTTSQKTEKENLARIKITVSPPDDRVIIPRLQIHAPIREADSVDFEAQNWEEIEDKIQSALREGVAHFPGTAEPGERGNAFITGHSSYYPWDEGRYKEVFALLPEIEIGEQIEVWHDQKKFVYEVVDKTEVNPSETDVLADSDDSRLTLMTCTPVGTALRRLVVTANLLGDA